MNTRTIVLTVVIMWFIGGVVLFQKYIEIKRSKKSMYGFYSSYESIFFCVLLLVGILMLQ